VPVYPTISASGLRGRFKTTKAWRGAAANAWQYGVDGIVLFNTFPKAQGHPHFTELGDAADLRYANKVFAIENKKMTLGCLAHAIEQDQILPVQLTAKQPAQLVLPIGDDIAQAARDGKLKRAHLRMRFNPLQDGDQFSVLINGQPAPIRDMKDSPYTAPGKIGSAFRFDGSNVLLAGKDQSLQIGEQDFSLSLWIKTKQKAGWSGFVVFVNSQRDMGVKLYWNIGVLTISLRNEGWNNWTIPGGEKVLDGQWHHYAATFDRDDVAKVYLDGKLVSEHNIQNKAASLGNNMIMQISTGNVPFEGLMDDLRLYHSVVTGKQISRLAAMPGKDNPADSKDLMGWWKFDDTSALEIKDSSGSNNHAHLKAQGEGKWLIFEPAPGAFHRGNNTLEVQVVRMDDSEASIDIKNVELHVDYQ